MGLDKDDIEMTLLKGAGMLRMKHEATSTLRKHWKPALVVTGFTFMGLAHSQKVPEAELLPGELSAEVFRVGCYTVRSANRVYKICEPGYSPERETPASPEETALVKKDMPKSPNSWGSSAISAGIGIGRSWQNTLRVTHEISARHCDSDIKSFTMICRAAQARNYTWSETIGAVLTAKEHIAVSDKHASLFVRNTYVGNSFSSDTWYKFSPDGEIMTLTIHPYDSDADQARFS